jgi:hypothetical protein
MSASNILTVVSKTHEKAHSLLALVPNTSNLVKGQCHNKPTFESCKINLTRNNKCMNTLRSFEFLAETKYTELINNTVPSVLHGLLALLYVENILNKDEGSGLVLLHTNKIDQGRLDDNDKPVNKAGLFLNHTAVLSEIKENGSKNIADMLKISDKIDEIENKEYCSEQLSREQHDSRVDELTNELADNEQDLDNDFVSKNRRLVNSGKTPSYIDKQSYEQSKIDLRNKYDESIKRLEMKRSIEIKRATKLKNAEMIAVKKLEDAMNHKSYELKNEYVDTIDKCTEDLISEAESYRNVFKEILFVLAQKGLEVGLKSTDEWVQCCNEGIIDDSKYGWIEKNEIILKANMYVDMLDKRLEVAICNLKGHLEEERSRALILEEQISALEVLDIKKESQDVRVSNKAIIDFDEEAAEFLISRSKEISVATKSIKNLTLTNQSKKVSVTGKPIENLTLIDDSTISLLTDRRLEDSNNNNDDDDDEYSSDLSMILFKTIPKPVSKLPEPPVYKQCMCIKHSHHPDKYDEELRRYKDKFKQTKNTAGKRCALGCKYDLLCNSRPTQCKKNVCTRLHSDDLCKSGSFCKNRNPFPPSDNNKFDEDESY